MAGLTLWQVLCASLAIALILRNGTLAVASAILLLDWYAGYVIYELTGDQNSILVNVAIDVVAAEVMVCVMPRGRIKALCLALFAMLMVAHASYAFGTRHAQSNYNYWYAKHYISWVQAALCLACGGMDGGRRFRRWLDHRLHGSSFRVSMGALRSDPAYREADGRIEP